MSRRGKRREVVQLSGASSKLHRYGYSKKLHSGDAPKLVGDYPDSESEEDEQTSTNGTSGFPTLGQSSAAVQEEENGQGDNMDDELRNFLSEIEAIPLPENGPPKKTEQAPDANTEQDDTASEKSDAGDAITPPSLSTLVQEEQTRGASPSLEDGVPEKEEKPKKKQYSMFVRGGTEFANNNSSSPGPASPAPTKEDGEVAASLDSLPEEPVTQWQVVQDEATQYYYYWNMETNEVTWEIPSEYTQYLLQHKEYQDRLAKLSPEQLKALQDKQTTPASQSSEAVAGTEGQPKSSLDEKAAARSTAIEDQQRERDRRDRKKKKKKHRRKYSDDDSTDDERPRRKREVGPSIGPAPKPVVEEAPSNVAPEAVAVSLGSLPGIGDYGSDDGEEEEEEDAQTEDKKQMKDTVNAEVKMETTEKEQTKEDTNADTREDGTKTEQMKETIKEDTKEEIHDKMGDDKKEQSDPHESWSKEDKEDTAMPELSPAVTPPPTLSASESLTALPSLQANQSSDDSPAKLTPVDSDLPRKEESLEDNRKMPELKQEVSVKERLVKEEMIIQEEKMMEVDEPSEKVQLKKLKKKPVYDMFAEEEAPMEEEDIVPDLAEIAAAPQAEVSEDKMTCSDPPVLEEEESVQPLQLPSEEQILLPKGEQILPIEEKFEPSEESVEVKPEEIAPANSDEVETQNVPVVHHDVQVGSKDFDGEDLVKSSSLNIVASYGTATDEEDVEVKERSERTRGKKKKKEKKKSKGKRSSPMFGPKLGPLEQDLISGKEDKRNSSLSKSKDADPRLKVIEVTPAAKSREETIMQMSKVIDESVTIAEEDRVKEKNGKEEIPVSKEKTTKLKDKTTKSKTGTAMKPKEKDNAEILNKSSATEGTAVEPEEEMTEEPSLDIDPDNIDDIDQALELALRKKLERKMVELNSQQEKSIPPAEQEEVEPGEVRGDEDPKAAEKIDPEISRAEAQAKTDLALSKLEFLDINTENLSRLQVLLVELQTRLTDWQQGGLSTPYFLQQLATAEGLLDQYETSAVPPGWACQWDRAHNRYFYRHLLSDRVQWEYPEESEEKEQEVKAQQSPEEEGEAREEREEKKSRSSRHRKKDDKDRDRSSKRDKHSSSSRRSRRKRHRRREASSSSGESETSYHRDRHRKGGSDDEGSRHSRHHHKGSKKKKRRRSSPRSPSVELLSREGPQVVEIPDDDEGEEEVQSPKDRDSRDNSPSMSPVPPSALTQAGDEDEDGVPMTEEVPPLVASIKTADPDTTAMGDEDVDGEAMEEEEGGEEEGATETKEEEEEEDKEEEAQEEEVNTAVICRPPQIIKPPELVAPPVLTAPAQPTPVVANPLVEPEAEPDSIADKGAKKKKKEKKSSSGGSSMMMKKRGMSSMVQKWQKVKKEVEKEDRAKELRQAAIRQKISQLK